VLGDSARLDDNYRMLFGSEFSHSAAASSLAYRDIETRSFIAAFWRNRRDTKEDGTLTRLHNPIFVIGLQDRGVRFPILRISIMYNRHRGYHTTDHHHHHPLWR
jgi:hypothetical protein